MENKKNTKEQSASEYLAEMGVDIRKPIEKVLPPTKVTEPIQKAID